MYYIFAGIAEDPHPAVGTETTLVATRLADGAGREKNDLGDIVELVQNRSHVDTQLTELFFDLESTSRWINNLNKLAEYDEEAGPAGTAGEVDILIEMRGSSENGVGNVRGHG